MITGSIVAGLHFFLFFLSNKTFDVQAQSEVVQPARRTDLGARSKRLATQKALALATAFGFAFALAMAMASRADACSSCGSVPVLRALRTLQAYLTFKGCSSRSIPWPKNSVLPQGTRGLIPSSGQKGDKFNYAKANTKKCKSHKEIA